MSRLFSHLTLALLAAPLVSVAQDNNQSAARSLVGDAAYLTKNNGKTGWVAEGVALTRNGGKEKHTGQLSIVFQAREGMPTGLVTLRWRSGKMNGTVGDMGFDLIEKDGKRFINVKDVTGKDVALAMEYSVAKDGLLIKGATRKAWTAIFDDDPTTTIAFRPGK